VSDVPEDLSVPEGPIEGADTDSSAAPRQEAPREPQGQVVDVDDLPGGAAGALEAVLMVVDEPISDIALATALGLTRDRVRELLASLAADYVAAGRGFELREVGGAWRFYSNPAYAAVVEAFVLDGQQAKLTQAALETLAVVAYRQPVARGRISAIRGVNVDGVMRTLVSRGLVEETGSDHETGAILYGTTTLFLERIGLSSLDELPALAPFLPEVDALDDLAGDRSG
jgi:segregation and condensation protein B